MEWLIDRRRMMYNKAVPPVYVPFEDNAIWEYVCCMYGDYNETVVTENEDHTVNITTSFVSIFGSKDTNQGIEKRRIVIDTQTNVDNSGGTYTVGITKEAVGITMKQMQAPISDYILQKIGQNVPGTLHHFEEFQYFTNIQDRYPRRTVAQFYEHIKLPNNIVSLDFYTSWMYSMILDFPPTLTSIAQAFGLRIRDGVTVIFRSMTPPTISSAQLSEDRQKKIAKMYVPAASLTDYQTLFNYIPDRIETIEGSDYEVFNAWEYND